MDIDEEERFVIYILLSNDVPKTSKTGRDLNNPEQM
jgi:hypothetical protein